jgi:hypothetical protein
MTRARSRLARARREDAEGFHRELRKHIEFHGRRRDRGVRGRNPAHRCGGARKLVGVIEQNLTTAQTSGRQCINMHSPRAWGTISHRSGCNQTSEDASERPPNPAALTCFGGGVVGRDPSAWRGPSAPSHRPAQPSDNRRATTISRGIARATCCIGFANAASAI